MHRDAACCVCKVPKWWWELVQRSAAISCEKEHFAVGGAGEMNDASEVLRKLYESMEQCSLADLINQCFGSEVCPLSLPTTPTARHVPTKHLSPACCLARKGLRLAMFIFLRD